MTARETLAPEVAAWLQHRTPEHAQFIETWAAHCGAPRSVFVGQLDVLLTAERRDMLDLVGTDVVTNLGAAVDDLVAQNRRFWRALDRLLADIDIHLYADDDSAVPGLRDRIKKARAHIESPSPRS